MEQAILERGRRVLAAESEAIRSLSQRLDGRFVEAVTLLLHCAGRTVTTGVGKAGAIARKIAATLASTGTPSLFLHPVEGLHGDLGVVTRQDIVIAFSYSGESDEVLRLLPAISAVGAVLIAVVGQTGSALARAADVVLDISVEAEACPLGLAPTTSTAAMLALGDAMALSAMEARGFTREDFARFHPAGALGRRLTLRVADVMRTAEQVAVVREHSSVHDVLFAITRAGAGAAFVCSEEGRLLGIITDGDVRRALLRDPNALALPAERVMNRNPLVIEGNPLAAEAFQLLQESPRRPGEVPVVDSDGRPIGMVTIKDLLRTGIAA
jgi:arabinose-5-phosphate isomerase